MTGLVKRCVPLAVKQWALQRMRPEEIVLPPGGRAFVFLAADYGNIGDLAISQAQKAFLRRCVGEFEVVGVPISKTRSLIGSIKRQITPSDLITIIGGGNMGSLYPEIEGLRQLVIRSFSGNRIVCFPQ